MSSFAPTEARLAIIARRHADFPYASAKIVRLMRHLYRHLQDSANGVLKPWGINHAEYNLLIMLYGTDGFALNPSQLAEAAGEKSANITRLTNELCRKGLLEREAASDDRRKVTLRLSCRSLQLLEAILPALGALLDRQSAGMQAVELERLEQLLKHMVQNMDGG